MGETRCPLTLMCSVQTSLAGNRVSPLYRVFGEQLGHERMARNLAVSNGATFPYRIALTNSEWANYYGKAVRAMKYEDVIQHVRQTHRDALDVERKIKAHLKIARAIKQGWEEPNG